MPAAAAAGGGGAIGDGSRFSLWKRKNVATMSTSVIGITRKTLDGVVFQILSGWGIDDKCCAIYSVSEVKKRGIFLKMKLCRKPLMLKICIHFIEQVLYEQK